jgi:hypothetical protein
MRRTILTLIAVLFFPPVTRAMSVHTSLQLLAWSADGRSALLEERNHGPEGGGSLDYVIVSASPPAYAHFTVSSNFSPGNGSRPQTISATDCAKRVSELAALLEQKEFAGVSVQATRCQAKSRSELVTVSEKRSDEARSSALSPGGKTDGWRLSGFAGGVVLSTPGGGSQRLEVKAEKPEGYLSPAGRMLLVVGNGYGRKIAGAFAAEANGSFRPISTKSLVDQ